ncbi:MAG: prepilin-type N-terminal cleavage/methylation domain-containing protein [Gemmatimonadota bacterium]|nr:prepilin-type N-terminal cleavage/methylation domain-containing protein [Gemmatimonadota bacterium]
MIPSLERRVRRSPERSFANARGFTLVEGLIAVVVVAVISSAFLSLLIVQDRFYSRMDQSVAAEQSLRAATDLAVAELRMAGPGTLLAGSSDSVSVRFDVARAVVCDVSGANSAYLFVYDSVPSPALGGPFVGTAYTEPYVSGWEFADGWTGTSSTSAAARTACLANGTPDTLPTSLYREVAGWSGNFPSGVPDRGSIVRRYRRLTYRFAPSVMGTGTALYRGTQELVGPLDPASSFAYVMAGGGIRTSLAPSDFPNVRAIRLQAIAVDDDPRFDLQRPLRFDIPFRN